MDLSAQPDVSWYGPRSAATRAVVLRVRKWGHEMVMGMARSKRLAVAGAAVVGIAAAAVAGAAGATTAPGDDQDVNAWALEYTGGTAGEASGDPIRIGYANSEPFAPEATIGIKAAVEYANTELSGAGGRPIELVECPIVTVEDAAACGAQFANDDSIALVMTGSIIVGNAELYNAVNGNKPVIIGNPLTVDDFVTPAGQGYTAGATGVVLGMAKYTIEEFAPETVAVLFSDNASGQAAANVLLKPAFDEVGVTTTMVPVADTATQPDVASAMQAAGAETADVFLSLLTLPNCINMYDSIRSLGIDPIVVTTGLCFGTPMEQHLEDLGEDGDYPDGWYFGDYGYSYFNPDYESGMMTYLAKIIEYGEPAAGATEIEYTGFSGPMFANLLTALKFMNAIGVDNLSYETLDEQIRTFTGPMMIQVGPLECGLPPFVATCGHQMGIQQYIDGAWVSIRNGLTGDPIDVTPPPA
jgi:branched-chain amino acid transport system substrate-binding protein